MSRIFGDVVHQALCVPDFDKALQKFIAAGIGPAFVLRNIGGDGHGVRYRGQSHAAKISAAFVYSGDTLYEVISPLDDVPSSYREFLDRHPDGGLQHIAYLSSDFDASIRQAAEAGIDFRIVQDFTDPESGVALEIYMEPVGQDDPVLIQLLRPGPLDAWFETMKAISKTWDGSDPIRDGLQLMPADMRPVPEPA